MKTLFWIVWGIDAIVSLVVLFFFFWGLADGTVSSYNSGMWLMILAAIAAIMLGSLWLRSRNQLVLAFLVLALLAIPGVLYGFYVLMVIILQPDFK